MNDASVIVKNDTAAMISAANQVINRCTYPGCSQSVSTRLQIQHQINAVARARANTIIQSLAIATSSPIARQIEDGYWNLGSSVTSAYIYPCGSTTVDSTPCVNTQSAVKRSQDELIAILTGPVNQQSAYTIGMSILGGFAVVTILSGIVILLAAYGKSNSSPPCSIPKKLPTKVCPSKPLSSGYDPHLYLTAPLIPVSNPKSFATYPISAPVPNLHSYPIIPVAASSNSTPIIPVAASSNSTPIIPVAASSNSDSVISALDSTSQNSTSTPPTAEELSTLVTVVNSF